MAWTFPHNWSSSYQVTYSFLTSINVSQSGREQRIAERVEPRRAITTTTLADDDQARTIDRFMWATQAAAFAHTDPVTGAASVVRLADSVSGQHPASGVLTLTVTLAVEPGTDTYADPVLDAGASFEGRYVFPFCNNWRDGTPEALSFLRQVTDYGRGRIAVTRPIAFGSRTTTWSLLHGTRAEATALIDFHRAMRGRQGEFWLPSVLDDLAVIETVSTTLTVEGDVEDMWHADSVNAAVRIELVSGSTYYRRVVDAQRSGDTTLLSLAKDVPDVVNAATVRRCAWVRLGRFASDDLTIEWLTDTVAQSQVQAVTLPYAVAEGTDVVGTDVADYFGWPSFALLFIDPLDYIVNVQGPRLGTN